MLSRLNFTRRWLDGDLAVRPRWLAPEFPVPPPPPCHNHHGHSPVAGQSTSGHPCYVGET